MAEMYKQKFETLDAYIVRLDKLCSQIFSIAFMLVLFSLMLAILYLGGFILTIGFKTYLPAIYEKTKKLFLIFLGAIWLFSAIIINLGTREKYRNRPTIARLYKSTVERSTFLYMGLYKPIQYINFTFGSNMPHKKYGKAVLVIGFTFFTIAMGIYTFQLFGHKGLNMLEPRNYFTSGIDDYLIDTGNYENQNDGNEESSKASIQSDIIEDPFLRLFINYPKILDVDLSKIYKEPILADSLPNTQKRAKRDSAKIECLKTYFQVAVNDSTVNAPEFFFEKNSVSKGIKTYISTENCKPGKNTLHIKTLKTDSLPKKVYDEYVAIPFWYSKGK